MARLNSCWPARAGESVPLVARHYHPWPLCRTITRSVTARWPCAITAGDRASGACAVAVALCDQCTGGLRLASLGGHRQSVGLQIAWERLRGWSWYQDLGNATHRQIDNIAFQIQLEPLEGAERLGLELIKWITLRQSTQAYTAAHLIQVVDMFAPERIEHLQDNLALELAHEEIA